MKNINNRQKMIIKPRENVQKFLREAEKLNRSVRQNAEKRARRRRTKPQ
ncbi:MAG: hypothetical protein HYY49_04010 [Ignavibacteriales bacterium]|nr:hypothetical protein [Ignavibacteriales bacterium]